MYMNLIENTVKVYASIAIQQKDFASDVVFILQYCYKILGLTQVK